jgi:hypothetical protein
MPDLSEILKGAVYDVPAFDPAALATRRRRQRRHQATGAASVLVVIATAIVLLLNTGGGGVVVSTRRPAATSTDTGDSTTSSGDTATTIPASDTVPAVTTLPPTETTGTTTTLPGTRPPQTGDFTGTLTASGNTVHVGEGVDLELRIHNASADVIDTSRDEHPTNLELYCDLINNPGPPQRSGLIYFDGWYLPSPTMQPGDDGVITAQFVPTTDFLGRATCQAVIVDNTPIPRFFSSWNAITAIDPVVITVLPAEGATTTIGSTVPAVTTVPPPAT